MDSINKRALKKDFDIGMAILTFQTLLIAFVVSFFTGGLGLIAYIIAAIWLGRLIHRENKKKICIEDFLEHRMTEDELFLRLKCKDRRKFNQVAQEMVDYSERLFPKYAIEKYYRELTKC